MSVILMPDTFKYCIFYDIFINKYLIPEENDDCFTYLKIKIVKQQVQYLCQTITQKQSIEMYLT